MSVTIHVPTPDTPEKVRKSFEDPGRPVNRPAGGWISDLTELQKFIALCPFCISKFSPRQQHYEVWREHMYVIAKCDGCKQTHPRCRGYIHQSTHDAVGDWTRRRGRWAR